VFHHSIGYSWQVGWRLKPRLWACGHKARLRGLLAAIP
jgi:hypothetical protein